MHPSSAMKEHISQRLLRLDKFVHNASEAHVILTVGKNSHDAEVVVSAKGVHAQGTHSSLDMYASIDGAIEKVAKTLKRHHDKKISEKEHRDRMHEIP
jgi:putative sigma-54 modulation protein